MPANECNEEAKPHLQRRPQIKIRKKHLMNMSAKKVSFPVKAFLIICILMLSTRGHSQGHYSGSSYNPNDYFIPASPGWVFSLYYSYSQMDYYNNSGDKTDVIEISANPPAAVTIGQNVKTNSVIPMIIYFGKGEILDARWGVLVLPIASSPSSSIALDFYNGQNESTNKDIEINSFGLSDSYIQPVWLTWEKKKLAAAFSYGVWIPTGKYTVNDPENVGLGYWSQNLRLATRYKPDPAISLVGAFTYELNSKQDGVDYTEADHLTFDFGSSYIFAMGHEIGLFAHGTWQVTDDKGEKGNPLKDRIYGIGGYGSYWFIPGKFGALVRALGNFETRNRFGGFAFQVGLNYLLM